MASEQHENGAEIRKTIKGWAHSVGEPDRPLTLAEVQLHVQMRVSDALCQLAVDISNVQTRLQRIELWMENNIPGYEPGDHARYLKHALERNPHESPEDLLRRLEEPAARAALPATPGRGRPVHLGDSDSELPA